jgi:type II secretory pathway pseudopilin PulG
MKARSPFPALIAAFALCLCASISVQAQEGRESDPASALSAALAAACRANQAQFANYLTADNAVAFRNLPDDQRVAFLKRFSLSDEPGKVLLSSDAQNHPVIRCVAPGGTVEFRLGDARARENLAYVPVAVVDSKQVEFGLVRENGGWRLLSLGLVLLDIQQLSKQWAEQDLTSREDAAIETLRALADAIDTYRRAFGKLPESLAQLGPAPPSGISPEKASLVSEHLANGEGGGYHFRYRIVSAANGSSESFELSAAPDSYGKTGRRSFFYDASGKVHGADLQGALGTGKDPLIPDEKTP